MMFRQVDGVLVRMGADEEAQARSMIDNGLALARSTPEGDVLLTTEEETAVRAEWAQAEAHATRAKRIDDIHAARDAQRYSLVDYNGHRFQADRESLWLLTFQVNDLNAGGVLEPDFAWWDVDNVSVPMTAEDLRALHHLVRARTYQAMKAARAAKDALASQQEPRL